MDFDLEKKAAKVNNFLLAKGVKDAPTMRVAVALDVSASMSSIIRSGALQAAFNQLMGVAVKFDDNGELDVFKFDHNCEYVGTSKPKKGDYDVFVSKRGIRPAGGTNYAPIVDEAMKFFFAPQKKGGFLGMGGTTVTDNSPVLMLIVTDGEPSDARKTEVAMRNAENQPIYFHMVGVGGTRSSFRTIAHLADELDNVGEVYLPKLDMSDEDIYEQLICDELIEFVGKFASSGQAQATA
jgi:hypothetical protein